LEDAAQYLKPELSFARLDQIAEKMSDTECARKMTAARERLLRRVKIEAPRPPRQ
jgi:hypothetical protein